MTAAEILDALPANNDSVVFTKDNLRVKLDELVEKGFVRIRKRGEISFIVLQRIYGKAFPMMNF